MKALLFAFLGLAFVPVSYGSTMRLLNLQQLTNTADVIVIGYTLSNSYNWESHRAEMWTQTRFRVMSYVKWQSSRSSEIWLRHPGGVGTMPGGGTWNILVPGVPSFRPTKKAMLFLQTKGDSYELVGWSQGYFRVETTAAGREIVFRDLEGIEFVNDVTEPVKDQMLLNDLVSTVRKLMK